MNQTIEKPRQTKFIYDLDIPKDNHTNLQLKKFTLTLELNPQSQVYHLLFTAYFSRIYLIQKIQMGYLFTSNFHEILQSHSYGCLVDIISISEQGSQYRTGGCTGLASGTIYFGYRSIPVYRFRFTAIFYIYK